MWIIGGLFVCFLLISVLFWKKPWQKIVYQQIITFPDANSQLASYEDPNQLEMGAKIFTISPLTYQEITKAINVLEENLKKAIQEGKGTRGTDHITGQIYAYREVLKSPQRMQDKYNELKLKAEGD